MSDAPAPAPGSRPVSAPGLQRKLFSGIAWTGASTTATQLLSWLSMLVVARLLTDIDYGIIGMAGVYIAFAQLVNEFGLGAAVVVRHDLDRDQIARIGGFSILVGLAFAVLSVVVAWPIGGFFKEPRVVGVVAALGITFVATGLRAVPYAVLSRDMRFRLVAMVDTVDAVAQTATTLGLALAGWGYWSLALGIVAGRTAGTVAAMLACPHPVRWPTPFASIASAIRFGAEVVVSRMVWFFYTSADSVILGRRLGSAALGDYTLASSIASVPVSKTYALYQKATSSVFAAARHDTASLKPQVLTMVMGIAIVTFPLSIGLALVAAPFVHVVLGSNWAQAIVPLQLLALAAASRSLDPILAQLLIFVGRASLTTRVSAVAAILLPVMFIVGSRYGPAGVAAAWLIGHPIVVLLHILVLVRRVAGILLRDFWKALVPAASGIAVMAPAVWLALRLSTPAGEAARLAAGVTAGAVTYIGTLFALHGKLLMRMIAWIRHPEPDAPVPTAET